MSAWKADRLATLESQVKARRQNRLLSFRPYPRQMDFLTLGATKRERLFMAGNKVGKTITGAFEAACHSTGLYPDWWKGQRFDEPTQGWIAGESGELVRDIQQAMLFGTPGVEADWGTGMIPKKALIGRSLGHGVSNFFDTVMVRHVSGGTSTIGSKTYLQGRERWQAAYLHWLWPDEEPPADLYSEGLARLRGNGIVFVTFTPFKGYTEVIRRFLYGNSPDCGVVRMGLKDAEHFTAEEKAQRLAAYPAHEREARENGTPMLGSGGVWEEVQEADITTSLRLADVPPYWPLLWGIDFGTGHPFAAVLIAWDRDADVIYVLDCFKMTGGGPINHAARIRSIAASVPVAWPHDGNNREASGEPLAALYKAEGLRTLPSHATHADGGGYSTEAGVAAILGRMRSGQFKVAAHLSEWFEEWRQYHRDKGLIVKIFDDLMSATRIAVMARRFAREAPVGSKVMRRASAEPMMARDIDFPLFGNG